MKKLCIFICISFLLIQCKKENDIIKNDSKSTFEYDSSSKVQNGIFVFNDANALKSKILELKSYSAEDINSEKLI